MKFERSHFFFGCDIMNYFIFSLFLLLLFDSPQASTVAHRRSIRALNTTLETDFDGTYERRNPCTNAEVEKSSYKASHEFRHYSKESNWSEYSRKCTAIISGFLQAIGNLVHFNNEQKGVFNFHINTSISQKQDRHSDPCQEKSCPSLPTIIIEATDGDITENAVLNNVPLERPTVRQSNCSITGHSADGVTEITETVYPNQEEGSQKSTCKPMTIDLLEKAPVYPTAPESQPLITSTYSQDTTDANPQPPVRQRAPVLNQDANIRGACLIPLSPLQFPFPGIAQTEVNPPAALTDTQSQSDFYGTSTRPESSPENYDANIIRTQPTNEITSPNDIEPSSTETLILEDESKPGPAYTEKSDEFNSFPVPSTISEQSNDGTTVNVPETIQNVPFYQSDEPRIITGEDQLIANNEYQPGQQPTNVIPEQPFSDSLGGQESDSQPLADSFTPADQFPTAVLSPEDGFTPLNGETQFGSPSSYPNQISPVPDEPQALPRSSVQDVKTLEQEITPEPNPSPEFGDLPYTKTPSVPEPVATSPVFVPPSQQPQVDLLSTNPELLPGNEATTPDRLTVVNSEYDELSDERLLTQPPQGENTFSNTESEPSPDGLPTPFIQGRAPAEVPNDSLTFTQSDISDGQSSITDQPLNDNQASDPTAFSPEQSSDNKYYPSSLLPEGQSDFSFETQRTNPPYDSEPMLDENANNPIVNIPAENTAEELPGNPEFISQAVPDAVIPSNTQFGFSDSNFKPTEETTTSYNDPAFLTTPVPEIQQPQLFPTTTVDPQLQSSPNDGQSQPSTIKTYVNEAITTVSDTISKAFSQFAPTVPVTEQPPVEIYETEQPQFTTVGPYEDSQTQATAVPQLGFGDEYANNGMAESLGSDFYGQQSPSFVQSDSQTGENAPLPSNYSPEQQPAENYNIIQSQTATEDSYEDSQSRTTDAPVFSADNGDGRMTPFPDFYNQETPNTFIQSDSQVQDNSPLDQIPSNLPSQQQPLGNFEEADSQIIASDSSENLQLQTNEDSQFLPPVEPASTFYDQQNPATVLPTQSPIGADVPFEQLPATLSPEQQFTENSESEVESNDDSQNMGSEIQPPLENANNEIDTSSLVAYGRQIPGRFLTSESQLGAEVPLAELAEQQPEGNYEEAQSQPTPYEDPELQTPMGIESQLVPENSEIGTTTLPDSVSYTSESPNTFTQPDSQLETNAPFNQFAPKEVQIESTTTQSETTDTQFSQLPALGDINQETPTVPEAQQPVGNDQIAQQSTSAQIYEDSGMQTTIAPELQPVPEYDGEVPMYGEYRNDRTNGLSDVNNQQYPSTSFIPNAQLIDSTVPPSTFSPEQQPAGNDDLTQSQLTSVSTTDSETTTTQFAATEEPQWQPSPGVSDQYLNDGRTELPAFEAINQQIPTTFSETESGVSSDASFAQFPEAFPPSQQPVGIYETEQSQSTMVPSNEELQEQTTDASQTESETQYTDVQPTELPDEQTPDEFVQPAPQLMDNSPFSQFPSTLSPEEQPTGNYEIAQPLNSIVSTYEDQTISTEFQTTVAPQMQPSENYADSENTELPLPGFINPQTPTPLVQFESGIPTNTGLPGPWSTLQENQADDAISSERSSEMEDPTSPALAAQPENSPSTLEISNDETTPGNIQPIVSQNDFQGADSNQNSDFTAETQFEDPSSTAYQNQPQFNKQRDIISSTETISDVSVTTLARGKESFGNPEQTPPVDSNTSVGYEDQSTPSSALDQVSNDDMTTTIRNIPALTSEETDQIMGADSPADIYVSNPSETVSPTGEYASSSYTNAENPLFVNSNLPYGYTPIVKPYSGDEQSQMITSSDSSVSSSDQFSASNYPSEQDQNSNDQVDQSLPESGMSEETSDVYPPKAPVEYVSAQPAQFPDDGQSIPQESPAADQPSTDSSIVSSTSDTSLYVPQSDYTTAQPVPVMPEVDPEDDSQVSNEYYESTADPYVGDDSPQIAQRKFSPRPILIYGSGNPSLADPETTLSPSVTTYSEEVSESQSEQFSPEDSSILIAPNQKPSDFETPATELQKPTEMQSSDSLISDIPEPTMPEEQATPIAFNSSNIYTQSLPQPLNPSYESQNLQQPFYSNGIPSQAPNSEEQVVSDFPQNENQSSFIPDEISESPENPQPTEQLNNDAQTEEVNDATSSQQPSAVDPMNYQPDNDAQPVIPYQPPTVSEQLPYFGAIEFPSEQQRNPLTKFSTSINSTEYETTITSTQGTEKPGDLNQMSTLSSETPLLEQQMTPESNDWNSSADSVVTAQPTSSQTDSDSEGNVSYGLVQPGSELESQSLISTAGNDQPLPGTFQPSYVPESQTETTLPYSNDPSTDFKPSFADSERNPLSSPSVFSEVQTSVESEDTSAFYNPPSLTPENSPASGPSDFVTVAPSAFQSEPERVDDSLSLQPDGVYNQFPPADSPNPTAENSLAATDYPSLPSDSSSPSETPADSYTVNPNVFDPRDETKTQETEEYQISGSSIPLNNAEQTPLAVAGGIPSALPQVNSPYGEETTQPTLESSNAQEVMPEPQPQPSLDSITGIEDFKTTDGMDQTSTTFDNTSPLQLNPEAFGTNDPNPTTTFQPESQTSFAFIPDRMNTNGDYPLADTPTSQNSGEDSNMNLNEPTTTVTYSTDDIYTTDNVSGNPSQNMEPQSDYDTSNQAFPTSPVGAPVSFNNPLDGQYESQPIQGVPELTDNVPPQIQSTTSVNYEEETNIYQSSPAPQPQTTLSNVDQLSDDNTASISPDKLENASPEFEPTPTFISQTTNPEFSDRDTQFQPVQQSQPEEENPVINYDQQQPSTVFQSAAITDTVESDISYSRQPDKYYSGMETNEGVPKQPEPEISPNPQETFNQPTQPEPTADAEEELNSGETDFLGDFTPTSPPFERPSQTQVPVTEYDITREQTSDFLPDYQPQLVDTQTQAVDTPMSNGQWTDPQQNIATDFSEAVTDIPPETQLTNTDEINNTDELRPIPDGTTLPPEDSSTVITESSSYSDSSIYNVRRRPNGRLFDINALPQSEGNNDPQVEYSSTLMPDNSADETEQPIALDSQTTSVDYDLSTQSPEAAVTQYDEATLGNENDVPVMTQPFDDTTEQPGLYSSQLEVPVQPQTDSPLDFEEGSTRRPVTFTPDSESFAYPSPPMQEEPQFNPLFQTLESHLIVPLPEPQQSSTASSSSFQESLSLDSRETSPVPNDSISFDQSNQNRFSTILPNFRRPEFDQNFVTSQPQPNAGDVMNTPQSDSQALVSDLTAPSNKPGEDYVSCSNKGSCPIMCPFDPVLKGNMTAPSYYILISKLPAQDNKEEDFRVEKVYLGDGTPLNCSFSTGKTFPTSLYTPVQLRSTGTVKLRTKNDFA